MSKDALFRAFNAGIKVGRSSQFTAPQAFEKWYQDYCVAISTPDSVGTQENDAIRDKTPKNPPDTRD